MRKGDRHLHGVESIKFARLPPSRIDKAILNKDRAHLLIYLILYLQNEIHPSLKMKFPVIATVIAAASAVAVDTFVERSAYKRDIAPNHLQRIASYRKESAGSLTGDQSAVLDWAENIIMSHNTADVAGLRDACNEAFGAEECGVILYNKPGSPVARGLKERGVPCSCSDRDPNCPDAHHCRYGEAGCSMHSKIWTARLTNDYKANE